MAHVGVSDQGILAEGLRDHPAAVYDTSWMNPLDTLGLLARVPAERIAFGTDPPYGRTTIGLFLLLRIAACLGIEPGVVRDMLGGTARRLLDSTPLDPPGPPPAPEVLGLDARLARVLSGSLIAWGAADCSPCSSSCRGESGSLSFSALS